MWIAEGKIIGTSYSSDVLMNQSSIFHKDKNKDKLLNQMEQSEQQVKTNSSVNGLKIDWKVFKEE